MKKDEVIKKMVLQLGGKEVELSIDEAKKLHEALNELFERKVITVERHIHTDYHYPWTWTWSPTVLPTTVDPYKITCGSGLSASYDSGNRTLMLSSGDIQ
jgi:hypothetical protein